MASGRTKYQWAKKPQRLNLDSGLINPRWAYFHQHLVGAWLVYTGDENWHNGETLYDRSKVGNNITIVNGSASAIPTVNEEGTNLLLTDNNTADRLDLGSIDSLNPLSLAGGNQITFVWGGSYDDIGGDSSQASRVFDKSDGVSFSNGYGAFFNWNSSPDQWEFQWSDAAAANSGEFTADDDALPAFETVIMSFSAYELASGGGQWYKNGGIIPTTFANAAGTAPTTFDSTTTNMALANWNHTTGRGWQGDYDFLYILDVPFPAEWHAEIAVDPFAPFRIDEDVPEVAAPVALSFPSPGTAVTTVFNTAATAHLVDLPGTINEDELIRIFFSMHTEGTPATLTTPSGYIKAWDLFETQNRSALFLRVANGTEDGGTVDIVSSSATEACAITHTVSNWIEDVYGVAVGTPSSNINTSTRHVSQLTAPWGAKANLWFAEFGAGNDAATVSQFPFTYSNGVQVQTSAGANLEAEAGTASLERAVATEHPSGFLISEGEDGPGNTTVIQPAEAGIVTENRRRCAGALWWDRELPKPDDNMRAPDRANVGWNYCGFPLNDPTPAADTRLLLLNPPGLDGGFGGGTSL